MTDKTTSVLPWSEFKVLLRLGYKWSKRHQVWESSINSSLPPLSDREGHDLIKRSKELVKSINTAKYIKGEDK